ncbi:hypothetical protein Tco_0492347 [Tanacetum coccineum]
MAEEGSPKKTQGPTNESDVRWKARSKLAQTYFSESESCDREEATRKEKTKHRQDRFTPLTKTPKEILEIDTVKFKASPPMTGPAKNQNKNKFCEFHGDKGHSIDKCIHLRRQIEETVKSRQLSHLVKEIKQGGKRGEHTKAAKKGEAPNKEKATAIFMV